MDYDVSLPDDLMKTKPVKNGQARQLKQEPTVSIEARREKTVHRGGGDPTPRVLDLLD